MSKILVIFLIFLGINISAQENFDFEVINKVKVKNYYIFEHGDFLHFFAELSEKQRGLLSVSSDLFIEANKVPGKLWTFLPSLNGNDVILITKEGRDYNTFLYNPYENEHLSFKGVDWLLEYNKKRHFFWYVYQNGKAFVQLKDFFPDQWEPASEYGLFNIGEELEILLGSEHTITGMTPDKMHLLLKNDKESFLSIMNIQSNEISAVNAAWHSWAREPIGEGFISNHLYFARPQGDFNENHGNGKFEIFKIGDEKWNTSIVFSVDDNELSGIIFHSSMKFAFAVHGSNQYIVDTTPFRDWLNDHNLLFKPTTGTLTASGISMRENPNLDAKILTRLDKGTKVDVIDRSGIKVEIGSDNDWWYKVRTNDNQTGWVYGPYLELEFYQGELEYKEAPPKVIDTGGF